MGMEVAVATNGARGVMSIDLSRVNYGIAKGAIDKYINSVGGSSGSKKNFPGDQLGFKSGQWYRGFGDKAKAIKNGTEIVFNLPNMMAGWQKWDENDNGKRFPKYTPMTFPAAGDEPIERDTLGDDDDSDWEKNDQGEPQDPWKPVLVFPVREKDDTVIHHVMLATKSSVIAGFNLFRDVIEEMRLHAGELPVVRLGSSKATREFTKSVKGKDKKIKHSWDVPTFEVVGWVDAVSEDNPAKGGVQVTSDDDADLGEVQTKARVANGKAKVNGKATNGKAPAKPVSRKAVKAEDADL